MKKCNAKVNTIATYFSASFFLLPPFFASFHFSKHFIDKCNIKIVQFARKGGKKKRAHATKYLAIE